MIQTTCLEQISCCRTNDDKARESSTLLQHAPRSAPEHVHGTIRQALSSSPVHLPVAKAANQADHHGRHLHSHLAKYAHHHHSDDYHKGPGIPESSLEEDICHSYSKAAEARHLDKVIRETHKSAIKVWQHAHVEAPQCVSVVLHAGRRKLK